MADKYYEEMKAKILEIEQLKSSNEELSDINKQLTAEIKKVKAHRDRRRKRDQETIDKLQIALTAEKSKPRSSNSDTTCKKLTAEIEKLKTRIEETNAKVRTDAIKRSEELKQEKLRGKNFKIQKKKIEKQLERRRIDVVKKESKLKQKNKKFSRDVRRLNERIFILAGNQEKLENTEAAFKKAKERNARQVEICNRKEVELDIVIAQFEAQTKNIEANNAILLKKIRQAEDSCKKANQTLAQIKALEQKLIAKNKQADELREQLKKKLLSATSTEKKTKATLVKQSSKLEQLGQDQKTSEAKLKSVEAISKSLDQREKKIETRELRVMKILSDKGIKSELKKLEESLQ